MKHITIIGMGLIGTSLALALRSLHEQQSPFGAVSVTGYDQNPQTTRTARGRLAIDHVAGTLEEAVQQAELVVLAPPVRAIRPLFEQLAPLLSPDTVVTDVASTKAQVCTWARELLPASTQFVGGHPMAGREQSGPEAATPELFHNAIYCLTPAPDTDEHALDTVEQLVVAVGAKPYYLDPEEHDAYVAGISHLPFLLSAALVDATGNSPGWKDMSVLAASGFRDITRLASGDVVMHRDICMTNRVALLRWIDDMTACLEHVRDYLEQDDSEQMGEFFARAREVREAWLAQREGMRPGEDALPPTPPLERPNLFGFRTLNPFGRKPPRE